MSGATLVAESYLNIQRTHSETLLSQVDTLLDEAGWQLAELDLLAAVTGPGSFTGLRIGIAVIKGLGQILGKPVVAVSSLQAVAANVGFSPAPVCVLLDARKKEVYTQLFRCDGGVPEVLDKGRVIPPGRLLEEISGETVFVGSGVAVYRDVIQDVLAEKALFASAAMHPIRASQVAWLAFNMAVEGQTINAADMLPTYIRPSDAELNLRARQSC